ncbi:MAG: carboxypeptidase-like regulatory domain-containing protein [archaeon]
MRIPRKGFFIVLLLALLCFSPAFSENAPWFDSSWHLRVPANVSYPSGGENLSINFTLNLTKVFSEGNMSGATLDYKSLRVYENLTEHPLEYSNVSSELVLVKWIANGTVNSTNRTFYIYLDSVANGPKTSGELILDSPYWRSGYINNMNDYSPWVNNTSGTAAVPYNRSWAKRVEISFKWAAEPASGDRMRLYVDGAQKGSDRTSSGSANESYWGSGVYGRFVSDAFGSYPSYGASDSYGVYGAAIDTVRFYTVGNYSVVAYSLVSENAQPQPSNVTAQTAGSYNYNETLEVVGEMRDSGGAPISGATVNAAIRFPNSTFAETNLTLTNSTGGYLILIFLPWEAPNGTYSVNISAAKSSFNASFNSTTFYYTADKIPVISDFSVNPSTGGWSEYFNFSANISDFDQNPDIVNATLWVNATSGWLRYDTQNVTPDIFANWSVAPFSAADIGTNRSFLIEYTDSYHSAQYNTSEFFLPEVERDDVAVVFFNLSGSPVARNGAGEAVFGAGLVDIDNGAIIPGANLTFWSDSNSGWLLTGWNYTDTDGNTTSNFGPDCQIPFGSVVWKSNYSGSAAYKDNQSALFAYSVIGTLQSNLTSPPQYSIPSQGDFIPFIANITDECSAPVSGAQANFTISNITSVICEGTGSAGIYNCTWNSAGFSAGNYSVNLSVGHPDNFANWTFYPWWLYLKTGPPAIIVFINPDQFDQSEVSQINASVTDFSGLNISEALINVTTPGSQVFSTPMTLWGTHSSPSGWVFNYTISFPDSWGNTSEKGNYTIFVAALDGIGSRGNRTSNFTVYTHVNLTARTEIPLYEPGSFGSIEFFATDLFGVPLSGLFSNLTVRNPSGSLLPFLSGASSVSVSTDASGFAPTSVFIIPTGAPDANNYTLYTTGGYYEPLIYSTIPLVRNSTFIVQRETELQIVPNMNSRLYTNRELHVGAIVLDRSSGLPVSADSLAITLYYLTEFGPVLWRQLTLANLTQTSPGMYDYYSTVTTNTTGNYFALFNATKSGTTTLEAWPFEVTQGGPFDVAVNVLNSPVPAGSSVQLQINATNMGPTDQFDVNLTYWIDDGLVYSRREEVRIPAFSTETYIRQIPLYLSEIQGIHNVTVRLEYDGPDSPAVASDLFLVIAPTTTTTIPEGGGGGGDFGAAGPIPITTTSIPVKPTYGLTISDYPRERDLFVERNSVRFFNVEVQNLGTETLHDLFLSISGIPEEWFEIVSGNATFLDPDGTATFIIRLVVPSEAKAQVYPISLFAGSDAANSTKVTALSVFASEKERLFYEIQFLKGRYRDLEDILSLAFENNKNVTEIVEIMSQAKLQIETAGKFVDEGALRNAGDAIRKAHNYLDRAEFDLNRLPQKAPPTQPVIFFSFPVTTFPYLVALLILILGIIVIIWLSRTIRKVKNLVRKETASEIKRVLDIKKSTPADLIRNRERIKKALKLINSQYSEKMISRETYDELKRNNEKKLAAMNKELGVTDED